jgi:4-aminobutyrate aminotransferase-like enzyme
MSSTHSANPMVCAAGKANLQALIEDGLIANAQKLGVVFHKRLADLTKTFPNHLSSVQGKGLVAALIFTDQNNKPLAKLCDLIAETLMYRGVIVVHTGRESIKLAPPLSITLEALEEGLDVIESTIADCIKVF